ncbi:sodium- and chloride-dependent GABA transporter 2-like isoform X1 [Mizuhopecten yessoensis]|uniref:sodium- and chloride-dependent GABA transporter 2-like isoform X1 n=2 Tax=Mizuhopecten yessoensis TaxID=6573 RepID=UPI000B45C98E|nr:sodium- and chloride-dependent GABA transporter 2-like isoform X1 [Mizuhopecten yessoensis]
MSRDFQIRRDIFPVRYELFLWTLDHRTGNISYDGGQHGHMDMKEAQETPFLKQGQQNTETGITKRDQWERKTEFLMCAISGAVGIGNIWRFPYLCYKNGGGAFLIPYLVFLVLVGLPMFILEIGLGQYMQKAGFELWNICPIFKGLGVSAMCITFIMNIYYVMVLNWSAFYFVMSLTSELPWATCDNEWNTPMCVTGAEYNSTSTNITVDSTVEFWRYRTLQMSDSIESPDGIVMELVMCSIVVWILLYLCVCRGIKVTGKIMYVTSLFPYVILTILLIRGVTLDGAKEGIKFYLEPNFAYLQNYQVWIDAGTQILFSLGLTFGAMPMIGSYNKVHNNFYKDCFVIAAINSLTSIYGGFAVFSILGFMAKSQGVSISEVADAGPGLAFITYPKAVTQMPAAPFWSSLFFLMLFVVGFGTQIVGIETVVTPIVDLYPRRLRTVKGKLLFYGVFCVVSYIFGFVFLTKGGIYVFSLVDYYGASGMLLVWQLMWEAIAIGWVVGADYFYDAMEYMLGYRVGPWARMSWRYLTPTLSIALLVLQGLNFSLLSGAEGYEYPVGAHVFGTILGLVPILLLVFVAVWQILRSSGSLIQRMKTISTPVFDRPHHGSSTSNEFMKKRKFDTIF